MTQMGIYIPSATLVVDKDIGEIAAKINYKDNVDITSKDKCNEKLCLIEDVEVLYNGLGQITLVKFSNDVKLRLDSTSKSR